MAAARELEGLSALSLVSCPIALYPRPARARVRFNQLNKNTGP